MPLVRRIAAWTAVAIAAGILVLFAMPSYRQGEASIAGKPALDFPLTLASKSEHLSDLKGNVVSALCCRNTLAQPAGKIYRFTGRNGLRCKRRRRWRRV